MAPHRAFSGLGCQSILLAARMSRAPVMPLCDFEVFLAQCFEPHGARYEPAAMQVLAGGNGAREKASRHARDRAAPAFRRRNAG